MLDNLLAGVLLFASWDVLAVIMIGMPIGLVFGLLPGLSGFTALATWCR